MTVYVSDLSNNNGPVDSVDFAAMKRGGVAGVILKAGEGSIPPFIDQRFPTWAREAHAAGLVVAAYYFGHPENPVAIQAGSFNGLIEGVGVPIAFRVADVETQASRAEAFAQAFCPAADVKLLYSFIAMAVSSLQTPVPGVEWWMAGYGSIQPKPPWGVEAGWQFTDVAHVPGVTGPADLSIFDPLAWVHLTTGDDTLTIWGADNDTATAKILDGRRAQIRAWYKQYRLNNQPGEESIAFLNEALALWSQRGGDSVLAGIIDGTLR